MTHEKHLRKKRNELLRAAKGFYLLLISVLPLTFTQSINTSIVVWFEALAITTAVWLLMITMVEFNIDQMFQKFDHHFLVIPASVAALLLSYYVYIMPELRVLFLGGWFTVLLFGGSLYTTAQALSLSGLMGVAYLIALISLKQSGYQLDLIKELVQGIPFWAFWAYSANIIQEHKSRRDENVKLRKELTHLAFSDQLTNLANRRMFSKVFNEVVATLPHQGEFALAVFDIDDFKSINDERGHIAGDRALCKFSDSLSQIFNDNEVPCRLGGDEFAVIIRHASRTELIETMDNFYQLIRDELGGLFTVSCGVITTNPKYSESRALRVADNALYQAKARGRNQYYLQHLDEVTKALSRVSPA